MYKLKTTILFSIQIYFTSIVSLVIMGMIYFLGYAVSIVILEGLLGSDTAIQTWVGIIAGTFAFVVFIAVWISLLYLGNTWRAPVNSTVKFLLGILSFFAALLTTFLFAVYLARIT